MEWALLGLSILFLIFAYVVIQGTRAALAWRTAAAAGDVKVIRDIVEDTINAWRSMKRPKAVASDVWRGVQSMQLTDAGPDFVRVSCQAQSEYKLVGERWVEVTNPLQEGMAVTARAVDMLLYELPHFQPQRVQIDIYTSFRETDGRTRNVCILTTAADRDAARAVDWEDWSPDQIVEGLGGRYRLGDRGQSLPVEPLAPAKPKSTLKGRKNGVGATAPQ